MNTVADNAVLAAWDDPVHAAQATFRSVLKALSEPGQVQTLTTLPPAPAPLDAAATAVCLTLLDLDTPLWIDPGVRSPAVDAYLRFHCGCPVIDDPALAQFALLPLAGHPMDMARFAQGSMDYPDRSTTLILTVPSLDGGAPLTLSGPGIRTTRLLQVAGLPDDFATLWAHNQAIFPLGVDLLFCCGDAIVGLPRTTRVHA